MTARTPTVEEVLFSFQGQPASWRTHYAIKQRLEEVLGSDPDFKHVDVGVYPWTGDKLGLNKHFKSHGIENVTLPQFLRKSLVWRIVLKTDLAAGAEQIERGAGDTPIEGIEDAFVHLSYQFQDGMFEGYAVVNLLGEDGLSSPSDGYGLSPRRFKVKHSNGQTHIEDVD